MTDLKSSWQKKLAEFCAERGWKATYQHQTHITDYFPTKKREHLVTVAISVPNSNAKQKKEDSGWFWEQKEAFEGASRKMLERLEKNEASKKVELEKKSLQNKKEDDDENSEKSSDVANIEKTTESKQEEQKEEKEEEELVFDLADDFKKGAEKATIPKKKKFVNVLLSQTVELQPWQQTNFIADFYSVSKSLIGIRLQSHWYQLFVNLPSCSVLEKATSGRIDYSLVYDYTKCNQDTFKNFAQFETKYQKKDFENIVCFNVVVTEQLNKYGAIGFVGVSTLDSKYIVNLLGNNTSIIQVLPVGAIVSFMIKYNF